LISQVKKQKNMNKKEVDLWKRYCKTKSYPNTIN